MNKFFSYLPHFSLSSAYVLALLMLLAQNPGSFFIYRTSSIVPARIIMNNTGMKDTNNQVVTLF